MTLNKSKGNMYSFVTHTWNTVKGKCPHGCAYCYCKKWGNQRELRFDESELKTDMGEDNFIFVGSSCDMWAKEIPSDWVIKTVAHCLKFNNKYLYQSKNPWDMFLLFQDMPDDIVLATTIESNKYYPKIMNMSPEPHKRAEAMHQISLCDVTTMVTVEPIMDFELPAMVRFIKYCNPQWVNIGANTASWIKLPEPEPEKIKALIEDLQEFTEVKLKPNLKRLYPEGEKHGTNGTL